MKRKFSTKWKASVQPRKQRKYRHKAPLHIRGRFLNSHLSAELRKKYGKRSVRLRIDDKVKVMRGQFRDKIGKVERINVKKIGAYIEGIEVVKKDGTKTKHPIDPSNLMITELSLDDKRRMKKFQTKEKK